MNSQRIAKYELLEKIAEGGFGTVYKARDPFIKRLVAIKTCSVADEEMARRFFREAEIAGRFDHPNVTIVHDFGVEDQTAYLVQEYLTGEDLLQKIRRRDPLPLRQKVEYLLQIAAGLAYAHSQQVIHRDIKPANLRVVESGQVKILDFGIAKLATATTQLTQKGVAIGTVGYLSPEQLRDQELDTRTDIFSYGVVAYELLTYARPFHGPQLSALMDDILNRQPTPVTQHVPDCPPALEAVVMRCLEKDRERRFQSFQEVIAELEEVRHALSGRQAVPAQTALLPPIPPPRAEDAADKGDGPVTRPIPLPEISTTPAASAPDVLPALPPSPSLSPVPSLPPLTPPKPPAPAAAVPVEDPPTRTVIAAAVVTESAAPSTPRVRSLLDDSTGVDRDSPTVKRPIRSAQRPAPSSLAATVVFPATPAGPPSGRVSTDTPAAVASTPPPAPRPRRALRPSLAVGAAALAGLALAGGWLLLAAARRHENVQPGAATPVPRPSAVPAPAATAGKVVVLATPWGELASLRRADGRELPLPSQRETPLVITLPAGHYVATLRHPAASAAGTCEIDAVPGQVVTCRAQLLPLDPLQYFKEAGWWR